MFGPSVIVMVEYKMVLHSLVSDPKLPAGLLQRRVEQVQLWVVDRGEEVVEQVVAKRRGRQEEASEAGLVRVVGRVQLVQPPVCVRAGVVT